MARRNLAAAIAALLFLTPSLEAVPHLHPELYPNAKPCHTKQLNQAMIKRFGSARAAVISSATGTKHIAVILVRFPSAGGTTSGPSGGDITGSGLAAFDSYFAGMSAYYNEVSFGNMALSFKFFGTATVGAGGSNSAVLAGGGFQVGNPMEYYGCGDVDSGCSGVGSTAPAGLGGAYLIHDALVKSQTLTTGPLASAFDAVLVMHAGYGNETTRNNGDIWSAFYQDDPTGPVIGVGGTTFSDGATFPESESSTITSPLGVMCHEFGHVLTLPDLYNTSVLGGASVVGHWDLMDAGPYLGNGTNPAHMGAWDKTYLGWAHPQTASGRSSFSISPVETGPSNSIIKMPVQSGGAQEYFLLEYRSKTSGATYDTQIPGTGLLIWHIDDEVTTARGFAATNPAFQNSVNVGTPHYGVSIVTADGGTISNSNQGAAGNAFSNFDNFIPHQSDNFSAQPSGVSVVKMAGVGSAAATFQVVNLAVTAGQTITKLINFPNPAGKGYSHPNGEGHTTIQFLLGRPATDYQINIYTLSGELVRKIDKSEMNLNTDRSADDKWVYEFDWDLKNGNGQHVAPGVYLYLVRADGQTKSAKAVVIR